MADQPETAPLYPPVIGTARPAQARFVTTKDGVRLRVAIWSGPKAARGTVFLLQGRTECIEKYGEVAGLFVDQGYRCCALDWRGQGLSQRLLADPLIGHVERFDDYLVDLQCLVEHANAHALPKPWLMLAHSMGAAIGLRALQRGFDFERAAFTGPMWDIAMPWWLRLISPALARLLQLVGRGRHYVPGASGRPQLLLEDFTANKLTTDAGVYAAMKAHLEAHPDLGLADPSVTWLAEALKTCVQLRRTPEPNVPMAIFAGTDERITDAKVMNAMAAEWPNLSLRHYQGGRHELLMERDEIRQACLADIAQFLSGEQDWPVAG